MTTEHTDDASDLLRSVRRDGISLKLLADGRIEYSGSQFALKCHLPALRRHADALAALLTNEEQRHA